MDNNKARDGTRVSALIAEYLAQLSQATGDSTMPMQQVLTLLAVHLNPDMNLTDMPKYTGVEKSSNSRNIAKLGDGERPVLKRGPGLLESYHDPMDRRFVKVRLTPKGKALMEAVAQRAGPTLRRLFNAD
jgi:DNA-binding MarR family transcriptional regulator